MMEPTVDVLLVDDEPRNLDALEATLGDQGYRLLRAEDPERTLKLLLEHDVAAIVMDIQMPGMSGLELARVIKGTKRFRQIPILFLTAHLVDDEDAITGYGIGAVDYLTKPYNPKILRHKIAVFADLYRKSRALAELNSTLERRVQERTAELERSEAALRAEAQKKDEFLATLAHELRNPLAPLRTGVDLLSRLSATNSPAVTRTLGAMDRQIDHLVRLIDDLLDASRISRGVFELKQERVDLAAVVRESVEAFRSLLDQRRVELAVSLVEDLTAVVDRTRVSQIIGNLLHNASKFTPAGGHVRVELVAEGDRALIRVADTGVGIAPDQLEGVFEMFARVDRSGDHGAADHGAGIGLALARRLAQMHGGALTASSAGEGRGTTFTVSLPGAERVASSPARTATAPTAPPSSEVASGPLDILVVEDNDDVADVLAAWLTELGHEVHVARTGPEGVEQAASRRPRVVLCDVGLPGMDGLEVCRRIRALEPGFRPLMIAVTGWGKPEDRRRTRDAGFDHHLVKPISLDALTELLRDPTNHAVALTAS